jgi:KRAB domain-containing zinc finger protein
MMKIHPAAELLTCPCDSCGYTTRKRKLLWLHMKRSHTAAEGGDVRHSCPTCGRSYRSPDSLRAHLKTHSQPLEGGSAAAAAALLACYWPGCGFAARFQSDLDRHALKHSADKALACGQCVYVCKRKSELNRHLRLKHSDVQERSCDQCAYKTRNMDHMKRHVRLRHTGKKESSYETSDDLCTGTTINYASEEVVVIQAPDFVVEMIVS